MNVALQNKSVKPLLAAATASPIAAWLVSHCDAIRAALQMYALVIGAVGGTLAAIAWMLLVLLRWKRLRENKAEEE